MELNVAVQAVPPLKDAYAQYSNLRPKNATVQYEPTELNMQECEDLISSVNFRGFLEDVLEEFDSVLKQNLFMDIFENRFSQLGDEDLGIEQGNQVVLQEFQSFTDLRNSKDRAITCVEWHPSIKGIVAMSCVQRLTVEERIEHGFNVSSRQSLIIFWSVTDPIHPQLLLDAPDDIVTFKFNPTNPNIIIGGCVNGQVVLWDVTEHQDVLKYNSKSKMENSTDTIVTQEKSTEAPCIRYMASSAIDLGHRGIVTDVHWLPRQVDVNYQGDIQVSTEATTNQFVTASLDGYLYFWDLRFKKDLKSLDLAWKPFLRVPLGAADGSQDYGLTKLGLDLKIMDRNPEENSSQQGNTKVFLNYYICGCDGRTSQTRCRCFDIQILLR
jgi:WD40 repeat protein